MEMEIGYDGLHRILAPCTQTMLLIVEPAVVGKEPLNQAG